MRTRMRKPGALVLAASVVLSSAPVALGGESQKQPSVEVVFVLDTTGSMSGLIRAAKEKIWAIANTLATTKPAPRIRMGLVGYRDRGDEYVTRRTDLTDDLDLVHSKLMAFKTGGGGDGPESVNQALNEAVNLMSWSTDDETYRVIFLVGDCPPHMDYQDDVKYPETCELAARKAIVVNAIQCGSHRPTQPIWRDIAMRAEGSYFRVDQSGSAVVRSTPFDADLAKLSRELDATRIHYGTVEEQAREGKRRKVARAIYEGASEAAKSKRAVFNASEAGRWNFAGSKELVTDMAGGRVEVAKLKDEDLPETMRKMSVEEREKLVAGKLERRRAIQAKIKDLAARQQEHIKGELAKAPAPAEASLDHKLYRTVKAQAAKKGIDYGDGPVY